MPKNEEDYSAYLAWQSSYSTTFALFSGFTFTAINMILFRGPDLSQSQVQATLFVLTVMLDIFLYFLYGRRVMIENCVKVGPPLPEGVEHGKEKPGYLTLIGSHISWIMLGAAVIMMYFIWNLIYLTSATIVVGLLVAIYTYITLTKPMREFTKTRPFTRR